MIFAFAFLLLAGSIFAATCTTEVYAIASDGTPLTWDVYTPAGRRPGPAVLVIHGGLYISGGSADIGPAGCASDLADAGFVAFSINYRLAPPGFIPGQSSSGRYPQQYDDVQLAVLAARSDPRANGKVGAVGGSAGATHGVWVSATGARGADRLDVAVGISGAYNFADFSPDDELGLFQLAVTNYVGVPITDLDALYAASPMSQVDRSVAPLYLVDSMGDLMPAVQLVDLVARLKLVGARNFQSITLAGDGHSFENWPLIENDAIAFLHQYLGGSR
jgi:acetyl esterase/lipase